jgi:hypothetical protein
MQYPSLVPESFLIHLGHMMQMEQFEPLGHTRQAKEKYPALKARSSKAQGLQSRLKTQNHRQ